MAELPLPNPESRGIKELLDDKFNDTIKEGVEEGMRWALKGGEITSIDKLTVMFDTFMTT